MKKFFNRKNNEVHPLTSPPPTEEKQAKSFFKKGNAILPFVPTSRLDVEVFQQIPFRKLNYNSSETPLGTGGFSAVYLGEWKGQHVAIKQFKTEAENKNVSRTFDTEKTMMEAVGRHPNIVFSYGTSVTKTFVCLVMEFVPGNDLTHYLYDNPHEDENQSKTRQKIALQIVQGLAYLWSLFIIHRDIKADNILLDNNQNAKIADFGLSIRVGADNPSHLTYGTVGTAGWVPPEAFAKDLMNPAICTETYDIWSYANLLWMLASHHEWEVFPEVPHDDNSTLIAYGQEGRTQVVGPTISTQCQTLLTRCWDKDPAKRPKAREIAQELEQGLQLASNIKLQ